MTGRKDDALLFWGHRFYADEAVRLMTLEQQGAYLALLWHAWQNDGLPNDLRDLARILGVSPRRLKSRIWPRLADCWPAAEDGRLRNPRQEQERARRAQATTGQSEDRDETEARERAQFRADCRWHGRDEAERRRAARMQQHAGEQMPEHAASNACKHPPPAPPPVQHQVQPPEGNGVVGSPVLCEAPAGAREREISALVQALDRAGYRAKCGALHRATALRTRAERWQKQKLTAEDVDRMLAFACGLEGVRDPAAVVAAWLDGGKWHQVLGRAQKAEASNAREVLRGMLP